MFLSLAAAVWILLCLKLLCGLLRNLSMFELLRSRLHCLAFQALCDESPVTCAAVSPCRKAFPSSSILRSLWTWLKASLQPPHQGWA